MRLRPCGRRCGNAQFPIVDTLHKELDKEEDRRLAVQLFQTILKYLGDYPSRRPDVELVQRTVLGGPDRSRTPGPGFGVAGSLEPFPRRHGGPRSWRFRPTAGLVEGSLTWPQIWRDEILMQALKQTIHNRDRYARARGRCARHPLDRLILPRAHTRRFVVTPHAPPSACLHRAWQLLGVLLSFLPASPPLRRVLLNYIAANAAGKVARSSRADAAGKTARLTETPPWSARS